MEVNIFKTKLTLVQGDITQAGCEAIANSANDRLWMGGGVAGAIKKAGGEEIETEAMKKGPITIGEVAVTKAGRLSSKYIIHAVVMGQDLQTSPDYIRNAARNTILTADKLPVQTLAIPAFGAGVGEFPIEDCAKIIIEETINCLLNAKNIRHLQIYLSDNKAYEAFKEALETKFKKGKG